MDTQRAWRTLREYAEGRIEHRGFGSCPDRIKGHAARDTDCPVCQALDAVQGCLAQIEEPASREHTQARMEAECNDSLERYSRALPMSSMESKIYEIGFSSGWSRRGAGAAPAAAVSQGEYPPLPSNISHVMRRIRRCEAEPAAQIVLEHAMRAYFDLGRLPAAVAGSDREDRAAWFALAMGAAASIEDAANCLRDKDAQKAAMGAATHVRESCNKLWWAAPALEAPAAPSEADIAAAREHIADVHNATQMRSALSQLRPEVVVELVARGLVPSIYAHAGSTHSTGKGGTGYGSV